MIETSKQTSCGPIANPLRKVGGLELITTILGNLPTKIHGQLCCRLTEELLSQDDTLADTSKCLNQFIDHSRKQTAYSETKEINNHLPNWILAVTMTGKNVEAT